LDTPLTRFLSPKVDQYYADYERGFQQRAMTRLLDPSVVAYVACPKRNPNLVIGQCTLQRFGNDAGYKAQVKSRDTYLLRFLSLAYFYYTKVYNHFWPDLSADPDNLKKFIEMGDEEMKAHWNSKPNRWEARSGTCSWFWYSFPMSLYVYLTQDHVSTMSCKTNPNSLQLLFSRSTKAVV
jgi:hypothetical protein